MPVSRSQILALTGNIGSGKSACAEILAKLGARVIDADILAREATATATCLNKIRASFGTSVFYADQTLNRKALGNLVFADPVKRKELEAIIHPLVADLLDQRLQALELQEQSPIIYVVPLLFEVPGLRDLFAATILVTCPAEQAIQRIMKRDNCDLSTAESRYNSQIPQANKAALADLQVDNSGTLAELESTLKAVWPKLLNLKPKSR